MVTGANGQLGWELSRRLTFLGEVIALGPDQCDPAQPARLPDIIRGLNPDVIVNAAGYTAVDKAEQEEELAFTVNAESVGVLEEDARRTGAILVHYSTDYVFDGKKSAPYSEEDTPCPINVYGRSKLAGETAIREPADAYVILRTTRVYAARSHNFVRTILRLVHERGGTADRRRSGRGTDVGARYCGRHLGYHSGNRSRAGGGPIWPWPVQPDRIRSRDPACNCASHPRNGKVQQSLLR